MVDIADPTGGNDSRATVSLARCPNRPTGVKVPPFTGFSWLDRRPSRKKFVVDQVIVMRFSYSELVAALLFTLCLGAPGCGNTCYVAIWDGSKAAIGVSNNSCSFAKATGAITVRLSSIPFKASGLSSSLSSQPGILHIFVGLRGIQAHANLDGAEAGSGWQDLAPDLSLHPIQIDLLSLGGDRFHADSLEHVIAPVNVPSDEYRQIRFRLLSAEPLPTDSLPEGNACGSAGWNCIIFKDGSVRTLDFGGSESEFRFSPVSSDQILFRVLPDGLTSLALQFDPESLVVLRTGEAVRLVSVFKVSYGLQFQSMTNL
jgi:uncharacterized protein DUF4382